MGNPGWFSFCCTGCRVSSIKALSICHARFALMLNRSYGECMDENFTKVLSCVSMVILVLAAFSLFFILYRSSTATISLINSNITDQGMIYVASGQKGQDTDVRGSDIAALIKNGLETDIFIDSTLVSRFQDIHAFDYSLIDKDAWYSVRYLFNVSGEITSVYYVKK